MVGWCAIDKITVINSVNQMSDDTFSDISVRTRVAHPPIICVEIGMVIIRREKNYKNCGVKFFSLLTLIL